MFFFLLIAHQHILFQPSAAHFPATNFLHHKENRSLYIVEGKDIYTGILKKDPVLKPDGLLLFFCSKKKETKNAATEGEKASLNSGIL